MVRYLLTATFSALLLLASPVWAQIYTSTDAQGNRVYSDRPHAGSTSVDLPQTNVIAPVPTAPSSPARESPEQAAAGPAYQQLTISYPSHDSNIRSNEGDLTLTVHTEPPLSSSHLLSVELDGQPSGYGVPGNGQNTHQLTVQNVDRGSHQLSVAIVDARGEVVQRSNAVTVHLQRTSLNQPGRTGKNQAPRAPTAPRAPNVPGPPPAKRN